MISISGRLLPFVFALLVLCAFALPGVTAATDGNSDRVITTQATAEIMATPDRAQITVSVQTENADVKVAQADNARIMDSVRNAIIGAGIDREDLRTTGYSIYPVYEDSNTLFSQKVKYYQVTNSIQVTIRDVSRTGEIIDVAVGAGANQVSSIQFMVSEELEQSLRAEVLTKAVNKARADADVVATAAGVTISGVRDIQVGGYYSPVLYQSARYEAMDSKTAAVPTPVEPGQIQITAQVTASYFIS